jgi:hypothetical protein
MLKQVRWEDLEDRDHRCPRCLHRWVSHGAPTVATSAAARSERTARSNVSTAASYSSAMAND